MPDTPPAILNNDVYTRHARLLCSTYEQWTGRELLANASMTSDLAQRLFHTPYVLASHGTEDDPIFNFANAAALNLFEMTWDEFVRLPSRQSAEPINQQERLALLSRVTDNGFIDDYRGVRISATGKRFLIERATVWTLVDSKGTYRGQAVRFDQWIYV